MVFSTDGWLTIIFSDIFIQKVFVDFKHDQIHLSSIFFIDFLGGLIINGSGLYESDTLIINEPKR
jgi:hypothetical protein